MRVRRAADEAVEGRRRGGPIGARGLLTLLLSQAILTSGIALSFPFFAIYLHRERGLPMGVVGALLGFNGLCGSVAQGLAGELSDLLGRRKVMLISLVLRSVTVALLAQAISASWSLWPLAAALCVTSFVGNFFDPAARGWVADRMGPGERQRGYGLLRIAVNLGWAVGPAVGGILAGTAFAPMLFATAGICLATAALVRLMLDDDAAARGEESFSWKGILGAADA
ncbi:MAG: MFS transporter, partial [Elusimicrobia bacterium]|nr:MFS transporter [Elusimicrobiota bacterium]